MTDRTPPKAEGLPPGVKIEIKIGQAVKKLTPEEQAKHQMCDALSTKFTSVDGTLQKGKVAARTDLDIFARCVAAPEADLLQAHNACKALEKKTAFEFVPGTKPEANAPVVIPYIGCMQKQSALLAK